MGTATLERMAQRTAEAAILARVSSDQGGKSASVFDQLVEGRAAAQTLNWHVKPEFEFEDEDISASRFGGGKHRPGWQALCNAIASGTVRHVIMWAPNRGSRQMAEWSSFLDLCRRQRVQICIVSHGNHVYDCANARDRRTLLEDGVDAEYDSEKISEGVRRGIAGAMKAGKPTAVMPHGYVKRYLGPKRSVVETDPAAAAAILKLFTMVDQGHSIADAAREAGISRGHAGFILSNMAYIARRVVDGEVIECQWPAIVPEDVFYRVQAIRAAVPQSATMKGRPKSTYRSLLGGLAVCGACGGTVSTHTSEQKKRGKVRRYRCAANFCFKLDHISDVDEMVGWELVKYLLTPGVLEKHLPEGDAAAAAAAHGEAEALRAELDEWASDLEVSRAAYKAREAKIKPLIEAAEERARQLSIPPAVRGFADRIGFEDGDPDTATDERLNVALQIWDTMPMEAARALLREVATVTIYPQAMARELGKPQVEVLFEDAESK